MKKRMTWKHPTGEWGLEGVDLSKLPPAVYGALYRLMKVEDMVEQINRTGVPDWLVGDILEELLGRRLEVRAEEVAKLVTRLAASEWQRAAAVEDLRGLCWCCAHGKKWDKAPDWSNMTTCEHIRARGALAMVRKGEILREMEATHGKG